jgi:hypothetical protein
MNKKALTFVEILVILGILAFLLSSLFIFLNPALIFRKTRDNVRYSDLLNFVYLLNLAYKELGFKKVFVENPSNMINKIYVSLPTEKCSNIEPPLGKTLVCSTKPNDLTNAWLPINFPKLLYLRTIKVDPLNYPPFFYTFELTDPVKLSYILTAKLETTNEYLIIKGELGGGYIQETTSTLVYKPGFGGGTESGTTESGTTESGGGTGGGSEVNSPPAPPSNLRVISKGTDYIMVGWDPSSGATSYKLDLAYDSNFLSLVYSNISTNNTIYNFSNLSPSTTYHVRVKAINNYGESSYSYLYNISTYGQISYDSFVKGFTNIEGNLISNVFFDPLNSVIKIFTYGRIEESMVYSVFFSTDFNGNIINSYVLNGSSQDIFKYPLYYFTTGILDQNNYELAGVIGKYATTTINPIARYWLANIILGKFDANLNSLWSKSIGKGISGTYYPIYCEFEGERQLCGYSPESFDTIYNEEVKKIIKTSDGILLIGRLEVSTHWPLKDPPQSKGYGYPLIIKTDSNGVPIYAKIIKIPGYEEANYGYLEFNDGVKVGDFYYLVGTFANTTTTTHPYPFHARDVMLAKMDEQGNIDWLKFYQISEGADLGNRIIQMLDGNLLITGTNGFQGTYDPFLLKVDLNGNIIKAVVVTPATQGVINGGEGGHDLIITSDNNYAMIAGGASGVVVFDKFNSNLLPLNTAVFRVGEDQWVTRLIEVNHRIYVIGEFNNAAPFECVIGPSGTGIFMAKLNQENYLSGCGCSGTSTIVSDITNQILTYTKTYEVLDYKYPDEPMYSDFPTSFLVWQLNSNATSTQYCPYYGGYGQIKNIKTSYAIKPYIFNRFLDIFSKLLSVNGIKYLFANLGSLLKY